MYGSSYSRAKLGLEGREPLHRRQGKSCGYYVKIVFFFSSLIQSLIIVSLVLFLVYGQPEKTAEEKRVKDLELNFNRLSENNIQLRAEKATLGAELAARGGEKAALEKELEKLRADSNATEHELRIKVAALERSAVTQRMMPRCPTTPMLPPVTSGGEMRTLQSLNAQQKAMIALIQANFTQSVVYLSQERDHALKDRDTHHQEAIAQRRDNDMLKEQLTAYTRKCKEDFAHSLDGIQTVTRDFLTRINNLFPNRLTFHLTCDSQQEQMEKIRNSCTNLSRDVENKFQLYLNNVGDKVAEIQALSSRLEVQNAHLSSDVKQCERSRSETLAEGGRQLQVKQKNHDERMEQLLIEQTRLRDQKKLTEDSLALKEQELQTARGMLSNCKVGFPKAPGSPQLPQQNRQTVPNWPSGGFGKPPTVR